MNSGNVLGLSLCSVLTHSRQEHSNVSPRMQGDPSLPPVLLLLTAEALSLLSLASKKLEAIPEYALSCLTRRGLALGFCHGFQTLLTASPLPLGPCTSPHDSRLGLPLCQVMCTYSLPGLPHAK